VTHENVAERRVAGVARAAQHHVIALNFARKEHPVAIEGEKGILELVEYLKVLRVAHADGVAMIIIAPGDQVTPVDFHHSRIIRLNEMPDLGILTKPFDWVRVDLEMEAVLAATGVDAHAARSIVNPKDAGEALAKGHDRAVKHAVCAGNRIAWDHGISAITPDHICAITRTLLPGNVGQRLPDDGFRTVHKWIQMFDD